MAVPTLESLQKLCERDLAIDENKLDSAAMVTPMLYHRWLGYYTDTKVLYEKNDLEYQKLHSDKYYYYRNDYHIIPKNASEINLLVDGDDEIINKRKVLVYYSETMNYIEKVLKQIEQRSFHLRLMLDWRKFEQGAY